MVFKDSYGFMQASLHSVGNSIPTEDMIYTRKFINTSIKSLNDGFGQSDTSSVVIDVDVQSSIGLKSRPRNKRKSVALSKHKLKRCKYMMEEDVARKDHESYDEMISQEESFAEDPSFYHRIDNSTSNSFDAKQPTNKYSYELDVSDYRRHSPKRPVLSEEEMLKADLRFDLLTRKGVYPYSYFDNLNKFDEINLPSKEEFYDKLTNTYITEEDYNHGKCLAGIPMQKPLAIP